MNKISGIYRIINKLNNKVYIGQSKDISRRYKEHFSKRYCFSCKDHLHYSMLHYGFENFTFEILKETYDLDYWEKFLIQIHNSCNPDFGYNLTTGGNFGTRRKDDFIYTDEIRQKMSKKALERWENINERENIIEAQNKGKRTENFREFRREFAANMWKDGKFKNQAKKLSDYWKGKKKSEETKRKMGEASRKRHERHNRDYALYQSFGGTEKFRFFIKFYDKNKENELLKELMK